VSVKVDVLLADATTAAVLPTNAKALTGATQYIWWYHCHG